MDDEDKHRRKKPARSDRDEKDRSRKHRSYSRSRSRSASRGRSGRDSRDRDRDRDKDRERDRERERERGRDRDRDHRDRKKDRDREKSSKSTRDRKRSRSKDRGRKKKGSRSYSRSRSWSYDSRSDSNSSYRSSSYSSSSSSDEDRKRGSRKSSHGTSLSEPSTSVMVRNVPTQCTEAELQDLIKDCGAISVRLIRDRSTGESRGFGFVEFDNLTTATTFVKTNMDKLKLQGRLLHIDFSHSGQSALGDKRGLPSDRGTDWICGQKGCDGYNFARRTACYQCGLPKDGNSTSVGGALDDRGAHPSSVIVVRGLAFATSEETVRKHFQQFGKIKDLRLIREKASDPANNRAFCFLEFDTAEIAATSIQQSAGLMLDDVSVRIQFSRDHLDSGPSWQGKSGGKHPTRPSNISAGFQWDELAQQWFDKASGFYYNTTTQLYYHATVGLYYRWDLTTNNYIQVDERGVPIDLVEQEKQKQREIEAKKLEEERKRKKRKLKKMQLLQGGLDLTGESANNKDASKAAALGPVTFTLKTQLNKDVLRWNQAKVGVVAGSATGGAATGAVGGKESAATSSAATEAKATENDKGGWVHPPDYVPPVAAAPKLLNNPVVGATTVPVTPDAVTAGTATVAAGDTARLSPVLAAISASVAATAATAASLASQVEASKLLSAASSSGTQPPVPSTTIIKDKWVDNARKACLLCKRQFKELAVLEKHLEQSELHKKNLQIEEFKRIQKEQQSAAAAKIAQANNAKKTLQRASEFEKMVKKASEREEKPQTVEKPIDDSNVGNRMLKAMGWKEGTGLGKDGHGRVAPVQAEKMSGRAGVGAEKAPVDEKLPGDTYQDAVRRRFRLKFEDEARAKEKEKERERTRGSRGAPIAVEEEEDATSAYMREMANYNKSRCVDDDHVRPMLK